MINIRPYSKDDKETLNGLAIKAFQEYKTHYNDWASIKSTVGNMASLESTSDIIVAEINNKIVGAVALVYPGMDKNKYINPAWASIRMLVVSPQHRCKGIGKSLASEIITLATRQGVKTIGLFTSKIMQVALPMYLRMGFVKVKDIDPISGVEYALYKLDTKAQ